MLIIILLVFIMIKDINKKRLLELVLIFNIIYTIGNNDIYILNNNNIIIYNTLLKINIEYKIIEIFIYLYGLIILRVLRNINLIIIKLIGLMTLIWSNDMILSLIGFELEMVTLLVYITITSIKGTSKSIKYYIISSIITILLLLGISLIYSNIGTTNYEVINIINRIERINVIGFNIIVIGLLIKLSGIPLHNYIIDIIENTKISINTWLIGISKISVLIWIYKLNIIYSLSDILIIVIILSILIGGLLGTTQRRIRRLLAYSSINNISYLLLGTLINENNVRLGFIYSLVQYIIILYNIIYIIIIIKDIRNIRELNRINNFYMKLIFLINILSLMGIPPLLGFYGKYYIILGLINNKMTYIIYIIIISNLLSTFYYIRLIKIIYNFENKKKIINDINIRYKSISILTIILIYIPYKEMELIIRV